MKQNGREKKRRSKVVVESEKVRFEEDGRKKKTVWKRSRRVRERGESNRVRWTETQDRAGSEGARVE